MNSVGASAPGKLVLLGEYAVLFGHPAMAAAVNRRARVELRPADDGAWSVAAPGFHDEPVGFGLDPDRGCVWSDPAADAARRMSLVGAVIDALVASHRLEPGSLAAARLVVDTREFHEPTPAGPIKLGLGSSAAATVALTEGFVRWSAEGASSLELDDLVELHRSFQGGRGSGIDLAASSTGGVVEYRLAGRDRSPFARPLELPGGLRLVVVWTGRSASTADFLARLDAAMISDDGDVAAALAELGKVSEAGISHIRSRDLGGFLGDVDRFAESMDRLGSAAGIPVVSEEHASLRALAVDGGLSYKPSGAGGGDIGIGFTDDPEAAVFFARAAAAAGYPILGLEIDPLGVEAHSIRHP